MSDETAHPSTPRIVPLGLTGVAVSFSDRLGEAANRAALALRRRVEAEEMPGVVETASALTSAYIGFDPAETDLKKLAARLQDLIDGADWSDVPLPDGRRRWHIPVCFEGDHAPQLDEVAELTGLSPDDAVTDLTADPLRALSLGYAAGQPYMGILPDRWDIPRQSGLTNTVPRGAVVVAVRQAIIFATSAPTGWRQVGLTRFRCFRPENDETPIPLSPGDEIQMRAVDADTLDKLARDDDSGDAGATSEPVA